MSVNLVGSQNSGKSWQLPLSQPGCVAKFASDPRSILKEMLEREGWRKGCANRGACLLINPPASFGVIAHHPMGKKTALQ